MRIDEDDLKKAIENIRRKAFFDMEAKSRRTIKKSKERLLENDNVVTGRLYNSDYMLLFEGRGEIHFGFDCPYAANVEFGTEPHKVSFESIYEWVVKKFGLTGKEAEKVAWAIVKKIERDGTEEYPYFRPSLYEEFEGLK